MSFLTLQMSLCSTQVVDDIVWYFYLVLRLFGDSEHCVPRRFV